MFVYLCMSDACLIAKKRYFANFPEPLELDKRTISDRSDRRDRMKEQRVKCHTGSDDRCQ